MKAFLALALVAFLIVPAYAGKAAPIGIVNNNPGNIRPKTPGVYKNGFPGAIGIDKNNYLKFRRPIDGIRAIVINLKIYRRRHGIRTTYDIVKRWTFKEAKPHVIQQYAKEMARRVGAGSFDRLDFSDPCVLKGLTLGIVRFENGFDPYPAKLYRRIFPTCGLM